MCDSCEKTEFGCCQDLENAALGPDFQGCPDGEPKFIDCTTTVTFILFSILTQMFLSFPKYVIVGCAKALGRSVLDSIFFTSIVTSGRSNQVNTELTEPDWSGNVYRTEPDLIAYKFFKYTQLQSF